ASGSGGSASKQASRSSPIAVFIALCCSGRLSVTVTTWRSAERSSTRCRYMGVIVASRSLNHALGLEVPDVVERVTEPREHVGGMLAERGRYATHARALSMPAQP